MTRCPATTLDLRATDVSASIRAAREELGLTVEEAARRVTGGAGSYLAEAVAALADVESGGNGNEWGDAAYWLRGVAGLWMFGPGGWTSQPGGGGYRRTDGAHINGNGTSSWCSWPGPWHPHRPFMQERMGPGDIEGPVFRRDVLRLMLRAAIEVPL